MHEPTSPVGLPCELRALAAFLDADDRPTALFRRSRAKDVAAVYRNASFARLQLNADFTASLLRCLREGQRAQPSRWRLTAVHDDFEALVRLPGRDDDETQPPAKSDASTAPLAGLQPSAMDGNIDPTDWTRFEVSDLSPWIKWVRSIDWSTTDLGPMCSWPAVLRCHMLNMMSNPNPRVLVWGKGMTFVYNEACVSHWGGKHPHCFAKPIREPWAEMWALIEPIINAVYRGKIMQQENIPLPIWREGFLDETFWNYTMLPIHDVDGQVAGVIDEIYETTTAVRWNRRRASLVDFGKQLSTASDLDALWSASLRGMLNSVDDIAFAVLYTVVDMPRTSGEPESPTRQDQRPERACFLRGSVRLDAKCVPASFLLRDEDGTACAFAEKCAEACKNRVPVMLDAAAGSMPKPSSPGLCSNGDCDSGVKKAIATPIMSISSHRVDAVLVTGLSPRVPFDADYSLYLDYLGDLLTKAASLIALPQEQERAGLSFNDDLNTALTEKLRLVTLRAERSEAKFSRMAAAAPTGMFAHASDGRPLYANDEYLRIVGETRDEYFANTHWLDASSKIIHPDDVVRYKEAYHQLMEKKAPVTVEYRLQRPWKSVDKATGQHITGEFWLLTNAYPEIDWDGKVQSVQGWITDISYRRFTESLVSKKLEDALESKRRTENFIDMTSHEMRNPLSAMLQSADSIITLVNAADDVAVGQDGAATDIVDAAETIILCAQHQKRIVDDILTLSKLDASLVEISPEKVQLQPLLNKALRMFEADIARVDAQTQVLVEPSFGDLNVDWVLLDASRLLQVLINLITNALKFVQHCGRRKISIALGASLEKPTGAHHGVSFVPRTRAMERPSPSAAEAAHGEDMYIQIAVTDTGKGLSKEEMQPLFQRFSQAPKTYKQYGGSGLGLYISRQLCELQGGQIGVRSADGKTTFAFYVLAKRTEPDPRRASATSPIAETRPLGLPSPPRDPPPPSEAAKTAQAPTADVGKSSHGFEGSLQSGQMGISPPERRGSMLVPSDSSSSSPDEGETLHVVLVEDNKINQRITAQQLRRAGGFLVHVADHGRECLDVLERIVARSAHRCRPQHIVLLDLEMPVMDGWTCAKEIRRRQAEREIVGQVPILALTANARPEQIASALEAGCDAVVTKPFRTPDLIRRMQYLMDEVARRPDLR